MLGGSAANFAVHANSLNQAQPIIAAGAAAEVVSATRGDGGTTTEGTPPLPYPHQTCVLHTSIGSDEMGQFVQRKLDEHGVEWSQTRERAHQVGRDWMEWGLESDSCHSRLGAWSSVYTPFVGGLRLFFTKRLVCFPAMAYLFPAVL